MGWHQAPRPSHRACVRMCVAVWLWCVAVWMHGTSLLADLAEAIVRVVGMGSALEAGFVLDACGTALCCVLQLHQSQATVRP